jgi:hypothetical protein
MSEQTQPSLRFIDEPIEVEHAGQPLLEKVPRCPARIRWQGQEFEIVELLAEWQNFIRRGRMARNMTPPHKTRAERVGSWGVGRFFFRVRTASGRVFEIYYDRAPTDAGDRKGRWVLYAERLTTS